ncbi:unnamed protein product, partial [Pylaiella littoralis]
GSGSDSSPDSGPEHGSDSDSGSGSGSTLGKKRKTLDEVVASVLGTSRTARKGDVGVAIDHFVANEQSDILRDEAVQLRMTTAPSPASPTSC